MNNANNTAVTAAILNFFATTGRGSGFPVSVIADRAGASEADTKRAILALKKEGRARADGKFWFVP